MTEQPGAQLVKLLRSIAADETFRAAQDARALSIVLAKLEAAERKVATLRRERDEAREQFDRHVEWAATQAEAAERRAQALAQRGRELVARWRADAAAEQRVSFCADELAALLSGTPLQAEMEPKP